MAAKYKNIYTVWLALPHGNIGAQPVKGNTMKQAKERFKKRFPKRRILDVNKSDGKNHIIAAI